MSRSLSPAVLLVFLAAPLLAQAPKFSAEPFGDAPAALTAASASMPPSRDYDTEILFEEGIYRIAPDNTLTYRHRLIYRLDTAEGVKDWAEISADWDPWYQKPAQLHARVLRPDGTVTDLDQKTITDAPIKADDSETFSSEHVRRAPLPGVAMGSIVEEVVTIEDKLPYFAGGALYRFSFRSSVPTGRERLVVELPATMPYRDLVHNLPHLAIERSEVAGLRRTVYEASGLSARHDSDIDLSSNTPNTPMVEFATGSTWAVLAASYAGLSDPQTISADAESILPKDLPVERLARIRAIVQRLHREVRYTGVEFGAAKLTPMRPSEVIKRHYGDCKDKSTLLVAMLRAAKIPANLALLSTGPGIDVDANLPGMNRFDHAIVYVPADGANTQPIWIDATAPFYEVGALPYDDRGRQALVIDPETKGLIKIPEPASTDSILIETRTFTLAELGAARVEETSETHGDVDASYREIYGGKDAPKIHDNLEGYVRTAYLAKKLTAFSQNDGTDLEHPFRLTLSAEGARRGFTSLNESIVAVFANGTTNALPKWFSNTPQVITPETTETARQAIEREKKSRQATYAFRPFRYEQRSRIVIPDGFALRALPASKTTAMGAATLTETYSADEPGFVTAAFRFDSGPSTVTADQALALRDAMLALNKRDYVGIYFDQIGAKAMAAGHIRTALEAHRALIAAHPAEPLHHVRLARALLEAGIGNEAQAEARKATELDPKSATAFSTLGWTLQHNALGERFGKDYDLPGAIAAYRKSIALNPEEDDPRFDLAILLEFNSRGIRYAPDSDIPGAIVLYRELVERNKDKNPPGAANYRENLLYSLLFSRQLAELDKVLATLPASSAHTVFAITSATAQHGAPAGIAQADKGNAAAADRNRNLRTAGTQLSMLHLYAEAADIMSAGMQGGEDAPTVARQIEMYRNLKPASLAPLPATNPASPIQSVLFGVMAGTLTRAQAEAALSRHAYASQASLERDVQKNLMQSGALRSVAERSGITQSVLLDLIAGNMTFTAKGDDTTGYSVIGQAPGSGPSHFFVVREDGAYRALASDSDHTQVAIYVLYALAHNNTALAKAILDWKRDLVHREGGDDPFAGPVMPRFWTVGSTKPGADSPESIRFAAFSLLTGSMDAKPYLAEIAAAREKASGQRQTDLDLLLAQAAVGAEDSGVALPAALRLLEQEPDSLTALRLAGAAYSYRGDSSGWQALLAPRLARKPTDHDLLSEQSRAYALAHDFKTAQATQQKVLDSGKATAGDYNGYAWLGLFYDHLGDDTTKAAQQSNMLSKNGSFGDLHTLACVYAAQGRTTEATQVLKQAMQAGATTEPNSAVWYVLGLIYQQYGEKAAALDAFQRVQAHEFDDHTYIDPTSTYNLAQASIKALHAPATKR